MHNKAEMQSNLTSAECCAICGKPQIYIRNLQKALGLPGPCKDAGYSKPHVCFLRRVIALRTFNVPLENIADLLAKEKTLLRLLKLDALSHSATWHIDQCGDKGNPARRLLLTGYDVGFPLAQGAIQANLDFGNRDKELFEGKEMGEDIRRALDACLQATAALKSRIQREQPVLKYALKWAQKHCAC